MQDQASKKVVQQLNVETDDCDTRQGNKVGSSAVGELTRSNFFVVSPLTEGLEVMAILHDMVKHFKSNPRNRKNVIWFCNIT